MYSYLSSETGLLVRNDGVNASHRTYAVTKVSTDDRKEFKHDTGNYGS